MYNVTKKWPKNNIYNYNDVISTSTITYNFLSLYTYLGSTINLNAKGLGDHLKGRSHIT